MFDDLRASFSAAFRKLDGKGAFTAARLQGVIERVQQALLDADVAPAAVARFMARVRRQADFEKQSQLARPHEQILSICFLEMVALMGPADHGLQLRGALPVLMLCGLPGAGTTTACAKLARVIQEQGHVPLLVAAAGNRVAATDPLHSLGEQLGVAVYSDTASADPVRVCQNAIHRAKQLAANVIILDTAVASSAEADSLSQLRQFEQACTPQRIYMVVDGTTGQTAVNHVAAFNEALELDGVIMTKLDADARGGAVLSVQPVTGVPIKYVSTGQRLHAFEDFDPIRITGRILGQGDLLSFYEDAQRKLAVGERRDLPEDEQYRLN